MVASFDAIVVGAGPAGAVAAYELARRGLHVAVLEKHQLPRYKTCGGVIARHVEKILDFPLEPVIEQRITKVVVTVNLGPPFVAESPQPFAYLVMRDTFDHYLVETARRAGAEIYAGSPLREIAAEDQGCIVRTKDNQFRCKYVIGGDGANSTTRKCVGAPRFERVSVAVEREIAAPPAAIQTWRDTVALDFGSLSSGYAWIFPKAKNFSAGAYGPQGVARELSPYYDQVIDHYQDRLAGTQPYLALGHPLPIRVPGERIVFARTILAGDAGGLIEPLTGEGIYYAIRSAQIAAETVSDALRGGPGILTKYQQRIEQEIQPEFQVAGSMLRLLDLWPSFWGPRLMKSTHPFWNCFCGVLRGEKRFQDCPRELGWLGRILFSFFRRK